MSIHPVRGGAALVLAWSLCPVLLAAPVPTKTTSKEESPAQKLRKELNIAVSVEFTDQPLPQAVALLREQSKVNLVLDRFAFAQMGMDINEITVSLKVKQVKLRQALKVLGNQCNLTFAIVGDHVLLTSEDMAVYRQLKQPVSVEVDKVPLQKALQQLARETGVNLVVDTRTAKEAQTPVSLELDDVPLETAVRLMAELAGLKPVRMGNVLLVTSKESAVALRGEPDLAPRLGTVNPDGFVFPAPGGPGGVGMGNGGGMVVPGFPGVPPAKEAPAEKPVKNDQ
jgi:hypothetical protein